MDVLIVNVRKIIDFKINMKEKEKFNKNIFYMCVNICTSNNS